MRLFSSKSMTKKNEKYFSDISFYSCILYQIKILGLWFRTKNKLISWFERQTQPSHTFESTKSFINIIKRQTVDNKKNR